MPKNVRFYTEATLSMHGKIILPVCCFPRFLNCLLFLIYIYIFSFDLFFFACCRFSPKWDHLCLRYLEMIFFTQVGPSLPKIFRDDFFTQVGPSVPKIFRNDFFTQVGPSVPKIFRDDFFHANRTICAQDI